jgi:hypothetical protein
MKQTLWIYSARRMQFTNGIHTITAEVSHQYPFHFAQEWYYRETGKFLHREDLEIGCHRDLRLRLAPPWKPKSPEEILRILGET